MADGKINFDVQYFEKRARLNVQDSITVEELWRMLIWSNHHGTQDFVFNGKVLPFKSTLRECKVVDGSILYIIFQNKKRKRDDQIPIQVNIVVPTGKIIVLLLQRDALIEEVKDLVFSHEGIPSCSQWLFCQGCLIPDDSWIGEISNPGDDVIHLMMCPSRNDFTPELQWRISSNDPMLTSLEILGQPLGAAGCQALADALLLNTRITSLNLYCSSVGPAGASALLPALLHLTGMTYLNLSGTDLQPSGIAQLCAALQYMTGLTELDLENGLDESGVCSVVRSLLLMPKLSTVRLDHTINSCIGELQTTGVLRYPVLPEVERRGCGAVLRHLQQSVRLRFCCCMTWHCLHQLSVALQCRILFPQPTFDTMYGAAQRLPRARLLRLYCYSGIFRLFAAKIVPRDEKHIYVRLLLLRTVCSAATASLLCNSGKDR